jgi:hypothetical protein
MMSYRDIPAIMVVIRYADHAKWYPYRDLI